MASANTLRRRVTECVAEFKARGKPVFRQPGGYLNRHERRKAEAKARTGRVHEPEQHERVQPSAAPINAEPAAPEVPPA